MGRWRAHEPTSLGVQILTPCKFVLRCVVGTLPVWGASEEDYCEPKNNQAPGTAEACFPWPVACRNVRQGKHGKITARDAHAKEVATRQFGTTS